MQRLSFSSHRSGAFTLTELIVAVSVLTLITAFVAQLVNNATIVMTHSRKHSDADSQARLVFDRMAGDFARMLKRSDVDYLFCKQAGNDSRRTIREWYRIASNGFFKPANTPVP